MLFLQDMEKRSWQKPPTLKTYFIEFTITLAKLGAVFNLITVIS